MVLQYEIAAASLRAATEASPAPCARMQGGTSLNFARRVLKHLPGAFGTGIEAACSGVIADTEHRGAAQCLQSNNIRHLRGAA